MISWACSLLKCERHIICLDTVFKRRVWFNVSPWQMTTFCLNILQCMSWPQPSIRLHLWAREVLQHYIYSLGDDYYLISISGSPRTRNIYHWSLILLFKHKKKFCQKISRTDFWPALMDNGQSQEHDPCRVKCFAKLTLKLLFCSQETSKKFPIHSELKKCDK